MAIRYSGDVEVRIQFVAGFYVAKVRAPGLRANGKLPRPSTLSLRARKDPRSPEAYDEMTLAFLRLARKQGFPVLVEHGDIVMRRTFQAPCPYRV